MIDSDFIIKYTNALYSTPAEFCPRYDEFRDMFSSGQIKSKEWVIEELIKSDIHPKKILIVGAWFGTLGILCSKKFVSSEIKLLDIDPRCEQFLKNIIYNMKHLTTVTEDMYNYKYSEDTIINTSCEHIPNIRDWLSNIPAGTTVILQSNNYTAGTGHISCANSKDEFVKMLDLNKILYSGEIEFPMYSRYMVIGQV